MKNHADAIDFTQLFVPQAAQSSHDRRAESEIQLAIPSMQSVCGMEISMKIVYENGQGEITEKKSRFIAHVYSIENEKEAEDYINTLRKKYWDARHNCFAYVCGDKNELQRFSDDSEPSGTAGKPILEIITSSGIHNCLIVVTRYFGGTLLGTGGLIRAYQAASKEGLKNSIILDINEGLGVYIDADYNSLGKIQYICAERGIDITDIQYTDAVHMEILIKKENAGMFESKITESFSGRLKVIKDYECMFGKTDDGKIVKHLVKKIQ